MMFDELQIATSLQVRPVAVPLLGVGFLMLLWGLYEDFILAMVGFFYPAWASFKAMEEENTKKTKQWLTYWVVYAAFSVVEVFSDQVLYWLPFYYILKLALFVYLLSPQYQGSLVVYEKLLRPLFEKHQETVDSVIEGICPATGLTSNGTEPAGSQSETVRRRRT